MLDTLCSRRWAQGLDLGALFWLPPAFTPRLLLPSSDMSSGGSGLNSPTSEATKCGRLSATTHKVNCELAQWGVWAKESGPAKAPRRWVGVLGKMMM